MVTWLFFTFVLVWSKKVEGERRKRHSEQGFTLIELLVVIGIIGVLSSVAMPQYHEYKTRGFNNNALSDLRNIITAQEAYYIDHGEYADSLPLPGFSHLSDGVDLAMAADDEGFTIQVSHSKGNVTYGYDSEDGQGITQIGAGPGAGGAMG